MQGENMQPTETGSRDTQRKMQDQEITNSLARIKRKVLVMSGKGGVGKSCISVNIAVGLSELGYTVGLMDVDLHGPSIPQMLGIPNIHDPTVVQTPEMRRRCVGFTEDKIIPARYSKNLSVVSIECMLRAQ